MIRSMTGFGRGESQGDGKEFVVEIKTVNHRYSDIFIKIPRPISFLEDKVREMVNKSLSRGKIDVYISYDDYSEDSKSVLLDESLAKTYIKAVELLRDKYSLKDDISVSLIARFPDILKVEKNEEDAESIWSVLKVALENALSSLVIMRQNEGNELKNNLLERASYIEGVLKEISHRSPEVVKEYKQRLENRIKELMDQQTIDEGRMAMEVAIFADRCSIDEEIVRLGSHISQMRETLNIQNQPVGRKLDFLMQEMNREINTIGSKANDLYIGKNVVEIKSELEKIREQIQNIE
ncbi:MAG: YicC family protein [Clostridia bacterium]|nr:YicC family protein [Clostridia bacterium]